MVRFHISLCILPVILLSLGCAQPDKLAQENNELKSRITILESQLAALDVGATDRELQTFEDMYVACQRDHPEWRYLSNEQ